MTDPDRGGEPLLPPAHVFGGAAPVVLATASADGTPNVTYLSKAHVVDDRRIALSDQFLGKTARNLAENPRASVLVTDTRTGNEWRLGLVHERSERRGPVFEALQAEVATVAALTGMQDVFRLKSAHIYRVDDVVEVTGRPDTAGPTPAAGSDGPSIAGVGELCARLTRCGDLDTLVSMAVEGVAGLLGYGNALLLLIDERRERLFTIASAGYDDQGVGSEVAVGEGVIGMAAERVAPVRVGNHLNMARFAQEVRRRYESEGTVGPGRVIPIPGLERLQSALAVPAVARGELVGVIAVEDEVATRYGPGDEAALGLVASVLAGAIESIRSEDRVASARAEGAAGAAAPAPAPSPAAPLLRFFATDGSTFLDGDYLIKGVAGRLLWSLLRQHAAEGRTEFTNREVRLDPTLDLPDFRDNFESRLILLKRRLDERAAPVRIERTGRGRFRLLVEQELRLELAPA